jgi:hypothetical protein
MNSDPYPLNDWRDGGDLLCGGDMISTEDRMDELAWQDSHPISRVCKWQLDTVKALRGMLTMTRKLTLCAIILFLFALSSFRRSRSNMPWPFPNLEPSERSVDG